LRLALPTLQFLGHLVDVVQVDRDHVADACALLRINLEAQAKLAIQHNITLGKFDLVSSLFIVYENGKKKNRMVKEQSRHSS